MILDFVCYLLEMQQITDNVHVNILRTWHTNPLQGGDTYFPCVTHPLLIRMFNFRTNLHLIHTEIVPKY